MRKENKDSNMNDLDQLLPDSMDEKIEKEIEEEISLEIKNAQSEKQAKVPKIEEKNPLMVMQFYFHKACKGQGCSGCEQYGRFVKLIPLSSMGKDAQYHYRKAQEDFIKPQEEGKDVRQLFEKQMGILHIREEINA